ncbi:MAG TPA: glycosyl hydrolase [Leptolyngbyaceae cyanobacterium M65_K2018_010]|nr:glycosyl hydrolase [Leptolyngbyaceae cyanobacterium M65_K2018_010]
MVIPLTLSLLWGTGCTITASVPMEPLAFRAADLTPPPLVSAATGDAASLSREALLAESWQAYRNRFIQADGRVIDWEDGARTVSEGQAYAMLRAVLADDPATFELTLGWAENNLRRPSLPNDSDGTDHLWAWKWGKAADGSWGILDSNFASDADVDAITALIFAARRWQRPDYLELARLKLADLWYQSTVSMPVLEGQAPRYLLPGSISTFQPRPGAVYLNPSYLAPYAFRLFAQIDPERDWLALVDSSYELLAQVPQLSPKGLPSDWVILDLASQTLETVPVDTPLRSHYGFDAYRVWWRIAWDAVWFEDVRAQGFLEENLPFLHQLWQQQQKIPAVLALSGNPLVDYEATAQYAMLYPAFLQVDPSTAEAMYHQKLLKTYQNGIWDNRNAYYVQNLAWLGLFPVESVPPSFFADNDPAATSN